MKGANADGDQQAGRRLQRARAGARSRSRRSTRATTTRRSRSTRPRCSRRAPPRSCRSTTSAPGSWSTPSRPCRCTSSSRRTDFNAGDIEPNIANYYSIDGKLQLDAVQHLHPAAVPQQGGLRQGRPRPDEAAARTSTRSGEAAKKLTVKDAGGKTVQYGFGAAIYGWLLEQLIATDGKEYCDNEQRPQGPGHEGAVRPGDRRARRAVVGGPGEGRVRDEHRPQDRRRPGRLQGRYGRDAPGVHRRHARLHRRGQGQVHRPHRAVPEGEQLGHGRADHRWRLAVDRRRRPQRQRRSGPPGSS